MLWIAVKMLVGNRGKYVAMVAGVFFSALVITQQSSIFTGLMTRTFSFINDMRVAQIWVMDPGVQFIDDVKPLQSTALLRVRGIEGVDWAMPLYKGLLKARLANGKFQNCNVIGIDDATLTGGPPRMVIGSIADLRRADGVIVDEVAAKGKLAGPPLTPGGPRVPLQIGDVLELNDNRAVVVGIARTSRTFQSQPVIYTTFSRATTFAPRERRLLTFILVKAKDGESEAVVKERIQRQTGLAAYTAEEFKDLTLGYFLRNTGIPINFGIAVFLGFVIGAAICGQSFYSFTADNMKYFGTLRAMGATPGTLVKMLLLQALIVGLIGYGLGVGLASATRYLAANSELAFRLPWQLPVFTAIAVTLVCSIAALLSIRKILTLEPAIVFRG
jgi:putative ABC transport system permease protein